MKITSIMTKRVATVEMDDTLRTINALFCSANFHHLLVVDNGELVGILSDRDLHKATSPFFGTAAERPQDAERWSRKVHQIMSREIISVRPDTPLKEAVALIFEHKISCLPVLSPEGEIEGVVTWKDLLNTYMAMQGEASFECCHCGTLL